MPFVVFLFRCFKSFFSFSCYTFCFIESFVMEKEKEKQNDPNMNKNSEEFSENADSRAIQVFPSYFNLKRHFHKNLLS